MGGLVDVDHLRTAAARFTYRARGVMDVEMESVSEVDDVPLVAALRRDQQGTRPP